MRETINSAVSNKKTWVSPSIDEFRVDELTQSGGTAETDGFPTKQGAVGGS